MFGGIVGTGFSERAPGSKYAGDHVYDVDHLFHGPSRRVSCNFCGKMVQAKKSAILEHVAECQDLSAKDKREMIKTFNKDESPSAWASPSEIARRDKKNSSAAGAYCSICRGPHVYKHGRA